VKPSYLRRGWGKYCSINCKREGQKNGKWISCFICNKQIYRSQKQLKHSKSKKYFCSKSCQALWRNSIYVGSNHPLWKGGKHQDYRKILIKSGISLKCKLCGCEDKRVLVAHHINEKRTNNSAKNLVWLCLNCHYLVHHDKKSKKQLVRKLMEALV